MTLPLAIPQDDGSDSAEVAELVAATGFSRPAPAGATIFGAQIRGTLNFTPKIGGLRSVVIVDRDISTVERFVSAWPAMDRQLRALLTAVYPVTLGTRVGSGGSYGTRGNNVAHNFGEVYATTDSLYGFAEGLVASVANWKLYAMGMMIDEWDDRLVVNALTDTCELPLRAGEMRPIGATIHATYAIAHILALYLHMRRGGFRGSEVDFAIKQAAQRIVRGKDAINNCVRPSKDGAVFFGEFGNWTSALLEDAK